MSEPTRDDRPIWAKVILYGYSAIMIAVMVGESLGLHLIPPRALLPSAILGFALVVATSRLHGPVKNGTADNRWKATLWIGLCVALGIYLAFALLR